MGYSTVYSQRTSKKHSHLSSECAAVVQLRLQCRELQELCVQGGQLLLKLVLLLAVWGAELLRWSGSVCFDGVLCVRPLCVPQGLPLFLVLL